MTNAQTDLIACLNSIAELAQRRVDEWTSSISHEHYEKIATIAAGHRQQLLDTGFPLMGKGAGLGFGQSLSEWGFPENGDHEMSLLGSRADAIHRTSGVV